MKAYTGHRSRAAHNVSLWLASDEKLYNRALFSIQRAKQLNSEATNEALAYKASDILLDMLPERTPDGARYTPLNVKLYLLTLIAE